MSTKPIPSALQSVTEKIVKAVPEILNLDTGCKVRIADRACANHAFDDTIPVESKSMCTVLSYDPGGRIGEDYEGDTLTVWCDQWAITRSWGEHGWSDDDSEIPEYEVLGRPITLEDVLRALIVAVDAKHHPHNPKKRDLEYQQGTLLICGKWYLGQPLSEQSPETLSFLDSIL